MPTYDTDGEAADDRERGARLKQPEQQQEEGVEQHTGPEEPVEQGPRPASRAHHGPREATRLGILLLKCVLVECKRTNRSVRGRLVSPYTHKKHRRTGQK